jgi:AcrR family transcriptional regulator
MHAQADLRVKRTKMLLREALIDLIAEKGFDAITVGDIAERAMVNRATFYRHYTDKYALVTSIFQDVVVQAMQEIGPPLQSLKDLDWLSKDDLSSDSPPPHEIVGFTAIFEHVARHSKLYRTMLGKQGSSWFAAKIRDYITEVLRQRIQESKKVGIRKKDDIPALPEEVATACLANWIVGMLTWWLESNMAASPEQVAAWCLRFMVHGYYQNT